ncbi:glycosyltransferase [Ignavibacterium sp.]|uniref:glycosyltransferase n=1 Tax=Ignavibacterium sp. TaxID=2651167 RepID=UPI00307F0536
MSESDTIKFDFNKSVLKDIYTKNLKMKKVLFVRNAFYPDDPRLKKQVLALLEGGYFVDILCLRYKGQKFYEHKGNLKVFRLPLTRKRSGLKRYFFEYSISFLVFFFIVTLLYPLKRYKYIVVHTLPDFLSFTGLIPKLFGAKIITDFHEPTPELIITKFNFSESNFLVKAAVFFEQMVIAFSTLNITVTNALRNRYIERGANPDKLIVISNAVDTSAIKELGDKMTIEKNQYFRLITHGSIEKRYGHEIVIRAIQILKEKVPNLRYTITGFGTYEKELKRIVDELELNEFVKFKGYLDFNTLVKTLKESDIGIIPMYRTPYSELIDTNKMYEYFELGIPVALPKLKPLTSSFTDDEVIFFEPGNVESFAEEISKVLNDSTKLKRLSETAKKKYEGIKWEREKLKFVEIFKR